jgi:hypothetical protein
MGFNVYIVIQGRGVHLGKSSIGWTFQWNIRAIIAAVITYLPLPPMKLAQLQELHYVLYLLSGCYYYNPSGHLTMLPDTRIPAVQKREWTRQFYDYQDAYVNDRNKGVTKSGAFRIRALEITAEEVFFWIEELGKLGKFTNDDGYTHLNDAASFLFFATTKVGLDDCEHWKQDQKNGAGALPLSWNYWIDGLSCSTAEDFD